MGVWGPGIYQNDIAEDIRSIFRDQLRRGKEGNEITTKLIHDYQKEIEDAHDSLHFWCALADTQWNLGRLTPQVKKAALECLARSNRLDEWKDAKPKQIQKRQQVLEDLYTKLNSPQPDEKKITLYKFYQCPWKNGDVYVLPLAGQLAKLYGFEEQFLLMQKVDELLWYPGHTIPVVYLKVTSNGRLPTSVEEYNQLEYIQTWSLPYSWRFLSSYGEGFPQETEEMRQITYETDEYGFLPEYRIGLVTTSQRSIPPSLFFLDNYMNSVRPPKEFVRFNKNKTVTVAWRHLIETSIKSFIGHNRRQLAIYAPNNQRTPSN